MFRIYFVLNLLPVKSGIRCALLFFRMLRNLMMVLF